MPRPLFKSPTHLVAAWPEVFEDLYINTLPIAYIELIKLNFNDGRQWEIDLRSNPNSDFELIEKMVIESFRDYENEISKLEFRIDILKLKTDVKNQSKNIL
jgi:hypothetical protein